jgi:hypothetical protein
VDREFISTSGPCIPIISVEWKEGEEAPQIQEGAKVSIELIGTSAWIAQQKETLKGKASVRTKITDSKNFERRQTGKSLEEFIKGVFKPTAGIDSDRLTQFAKEMGLV